MKSKEKVTQFINNLMDGEAKKPAHDEMKMFRIIENVGGDENMIRVSIYFDRLSDDNYHFQFPRNVTRDKMAVMLRHTADLIMGVCK